jgi:DNA (cytosine-5)-methyltransferase 1
VKYVSLFDGIGAAHAAWMPLGWECLWTAEIEKFPIAVVKARFPGIPNLGDVTKITQEMIDGYPRPDVVIGGSPCQSFSVAGLRGGLADPRGNLALRFVQLVGALAPRWVVWENVPGVLSSGSGRDFGSILGALAELGYGWAYRVLDAQHFGVAQRRRRVFVVGCFGDWRRAAAVLSVAQGMRGDPPPSRPTRQVAAPDAGRGAEGASWPRSIAPCPDASFAKNQGLDEHGYGMSVPAVTSHDPACCLTARELKGPLPEADLSTVVMEPFVKAKRAQSASDDETWKADGVSPTLNHFDVGDTRSTTVVAFTQNQRDEVRDLGGTAGALSGPGTHQSTYVAEAFSVREDAKAGNFSATPTDVGLAVQAHQPRAPSHHARIFVAQNTFPIDTQNMTEGHRSGGKGHGEANDPSFTITKGHSHAVAFQTRIGRNGRGQPSDVTPALSGASAGATSDMRPCVATSMAVRRLTPLECERLQGFPDGWTQIPWRKKPAEECPDGPRYRALGNSMAVPVIRWIGERVAKVQKI